MGKFGSLVGDFNDIDLASGVKGLEVFLENFSGRLGNRTAVTEGKYRRTGTGYVQVLLSQESFPSDGQNQG